MENQWVHTPEEQATSHRWGIWLLIPLLTGIVMLCILSREWASRLAVQRIVIAGTHILHGQDVLSLANISPKAPMYKLNLFEIRKRIESQPFVRSVRVNREMPDILYIEIVERQPIASLNGGQLRYVDAEGVVLPYVQSAEKLDVPMISGIKGLQNMPSGQISPSDGLSLAIGVLQTALRIDSTMYRLISEVKLNDNDDIVLYSAEGGVPILIGQGDVGKKLVALQTFWNNFAKSGEAEKIRYIDLRFDGQVVVKWNREAESKSSKYPL